MHNMTDHISTKCVIVCKCTLPTGMLSEWALSNNGTSNMVNLAFIWSFSLINWVDNVNWPPSIVSKLTLRALALRQSDWRNCGLCVCLPYLLDLNAALESSWFSRNVAWYLQVKHALAREIFLLIWTIHSALFNFRFAIKEERSSKETKWADSWIPWERRAFVLNAYTFPSLFFIHLEIETYTLMEMHWTD